MSDVWVVNDTTPRSYTLGGGDLTGADSVRAAMRKGATTVSLPATVVDATTVQLDRNVALTVGRWQLEVEATFPQGVQTFPEDRPRTVLVRDEIVEA